jgi:hypothetical protein
LSDTHHYTDPGEAARTLQARQADVANWREHHPETEPLSVAAVLADQAANRSRVDPTFAAAWSLLSGGFAVLPCDPAAGHSPAPSRYATPAP